MEGKEKERKRERERRLGAEGVGGERENGGVFEFPNWQHEGEALATPQSSHCLLFTHTVDSKQWHTHSFGTVWWRLEVKHPSFPFQTNRLTLVD